jgi:hypothetical protein
VRTALLLREGIFFIAMTLEMAKHILAISPTTANTLVTELKGLGLDS